MGDRYVLEVTCPKCGLRDDDVPYAPTCGFVDWKCDNCGHVVDLEKYTGISRKKASNAGVIQKLIAKIGHD